MPDIQFNYCSQYERNPPLPVTGTINVGDKDDITTILELIFTACNTIDENTLSMFPNYPNMTSRDIVMIEDKYYLCCPTCWCEVTKLEADMWWGLSHNDLFEWAEECNIMGDTSIYGAL